MTRVPAPQVRPTHALRDLPTLPGVLRARAEREPDRLAYRFLPDGGATETCLTYAELASASHAIAHGLRARAAPGDRVVLLLPPGLDLVASFLGCLAARVVAVMLPEPRASQRNTSLARLGGIATDAAPALIVCTEAGHGAMAQDPGLAEPLRRASWTTVESLKSGGHGAWDQPDPAPEDLAFLQYTSGSTADPRGVMVTHGNVAHNLEAIRDRFDLTADSRIVCWLPPYHDMGLVGGILEPLYAGAEATLMPTDAFIQRPWRWLEAMSRHGGTTSGGPDFAYELCVQRIGASRRAELDLTSWRVAFDGAEPVRAETLDRFVEAFAPCGFNRAAFRPCYGLAEATLLVSTSLSGAAPVVGHFRRDVLERGIASPCPPGDEGACTLVSCGPPVGDTIVVDPSRHEPLPPGGVGEIWHGGASVARGYWNDAEGTARTFHARLARGAGGSFLRTGDLGFLLEGRLYVTGRIKDLLIIDGRNHDPADIELTAGGCHGALRARDCVAIPVADSGPEELVLLVGLRHVGDVDFVLLGRTIRAALSREHGLRVRAVVFVRAGRLPRTPSGKIRRRACKQAWQDGSLAPVEST